MDVVLYLFFGMIDVTGILYLMFRIYRFPFFDYLKPILVVALIISSESYISRVVFGLPLVDIFFHLFAAVLFLRCYVRVLLKYSVLIAGTGYMTFAGLNTLAYSVLLYTGVVEQLVDLHYDSYLSYIVQISTGVSVVLVGLLFKKFNFGYSFILAPPHAVNKPMTRMDLILNIIVILSLIAVISTYVWLMSFPAYVVVPVSAAIILIVFVSSRIRDGSNDRSVGALHSQKDKEDFPG